jgi:hypothetical protein
VFPLFLTNEDKRNVSSSALSLLNRRNAASTGANRQLNVSLVEFDSVTSIDHLTDDNAFTAAASDNTAIPV